MNLDELRQAMASDATKENERLKHKVSILREQLYDSEKNYEVLIGDCLALANRCWVMSRGTICWSCALSVFECPHARINLRKLKKENDR